MRAGGLVHYGNDVIKQDHKQETTILNRRDADRPATAAVSILPEVEKEGQTQSRQQFHPLFRSMTTENRSATPENNGTRYLLDSLTDHVLLAHAHIELCN